MVVYKYPKGLSNKNKTLGKSTVSDQYPSPFIDKLSVTLDVTKTGKPHEIHSSIWDHFAELNGPFKAANGGKWGEYKVSKRIALGTVLDATKWPLFQYGYEKEEGIATKIRIEFVPVDLGAQGMMELHSVLQVILPDGWGTFVKHGSVTRLDVAVDYPSVTMHEFLFLPQQLATTTTWKTDGSLQTYQSGKSSGNCTSIYDRAAKREAQHKGWQNKSGIRIERRLRNPGLLVSGLASLDNVFAGISMVEVLVDPSNGEKAKPYIWSLFLCAVEQRGLVAALGLLPPDKRTMYRAHYATHTHSWWNPEAIWKQWTDMLDETGLLSLGAE